MDKYRVLFVGESWFFSRTEAKGVDNFTVSGYETEIGRVRSYMSEYADITHIPAHEVMSSFPKRYDEIENYDVVITSDVGANSYLMPPETFFGCQQSPNKLDVIAEYVSKGGTFIMMGGYMAYSGFQARGNFKDTIIEEILPVSILPYDDRQEHCEGIRIEATDSDHLVLEGINGEWPVLLGYNRTVAKDGVEVVLKYKDDPILAIGTYGEGKTVAWMSDCAPHWMPEKFCKSGMNTRLWKNVFDYCTRSPKS
jgi:uncharacterized membrane protein